MELNFTIQKGYSNAIRRTWYQNYNTAKTWSLTTTMPAEAFYQPIPLSFSSMQNANSADIMNLLYGNRYGLISPDSINILWKRISSGIEIWVEYINERKNIIRRQKLLTLNNLREAFKVVVEDCDSHFYVTATRLYTNIKVECQLEKGETSTYYIWRMFQDPVFNELNKVAPATMQFKYIIE